VADLVKPLVRYHHGRGWHKFATVPGTAAYLSDMAPDRRAAATRLT
jgi:hypothetical protein